MFRRKKNKPDYAHIAQLERELGLGYEPDDELGKEIEAARMTALAARRKPDSGPVLLDKKLAPVSHLAQLSVGHYESKRAQDQALFFGPGAKWPVTDYDDIRPLHNVCATAYCASAVATIPKPASRVVLPSGVNA